MGLLTLRIGTTPNKVRLDQFRGGQGLTSRVNNFKHSKCGTTVGVRKNRKCKLLGDELCPLTSCTFRKLPQSSSYDDEMASEPWFYVDENDVFPEEFRKFLGLAEPLRQEFISHHADLFSVDFWQQTQAAIEAGELTHIYPYERSARLI